MTSGLSEDERTKLSKLTNLVFWQWYNLSSTFRAVMQLSLMLRAMEENDVGKLRSARESLDRLIAELNESMDRMDQALDQIPDFRDAQPE